MTAEAALKFNYAEVCVNAHGGRMQTFSYAIPAGMDIRSGQAVWVPFGSRTLQGIVIELTETPAVEEVKEIRGVIEAEPLITPARVALARWISEYYLSPLFDSISLMLPPGFERRVMTYVERHFDKLSDRTGETNGNGKTQGTAPAKKMDTFTPEQAKVLELTGEGKTALKEIEKEIGKRKAQNAVTQLVNRGFLERSYELEKPRVTAKTVPYLRLLAAVEAAVEEASRLRKGRARKQGELLELLIEAGRAVSLTAAKKKGKFTAAHVKALVDKGFIEVRQVEVRREPITTLQMSLSLPLALTPDQQAAYEAIKESLNQAGGFQTRPYTGEHDRQGDVFLLHGVTGSGKTEVYLQALAEAVRLGKRGLALVPEISLTPQTIERFAARFPNRVAVLHSRLTLGEQFDEWQRIKNGEFDVVVGPRSALFAPLPDLGIIIMDEEHEWNYKQSEKWPRYHARDAAIKLAELTGAAVVLGSATPDVGTYYHAEQGDYKLLSLPERVTPVAGTPLPGVDVIDLKQELMSGNRSIFSRPLSQAITEALEKQEQILLFLNRRGSATFVQCRRCGFVMRCKRCDVSLTYHFDENMLICHQCNYRTPVPVICPRCSSNRIKFVGIGTQKVEQEAKLAFPEARLLRWDSDVTGGRHSHENLLNKFRDHKADILIGTQMIAKGLDLPNVTLVGVINADTALNLPDFRAGERTFQLLSQVAGRAGRGIRGGRVIVQSYDPTHYAIQAAAKHDYASFYNQEMGYRRELNDPPFSRLVRLGYSGSNDNRCLEEAGKMVKILASERDAAGIPDLVILGPAPEFIHKLRGRYRWSVILRGLNPTEVLKNVPLPRGWTVDVDPVGIT